MERRGGGRETEWSLQGEMRRAESSLQGRLEASKEIWRDEEAAERQETSRRDREMRTIAE